MFNIYKQKELLGIRHIPATADEIAGRNVMQTPNPEIHAAKYYYVELPAKPVLSFHIDSSLP